MTAQALREVFITLHAYEDTSALDDLTLLARGVANDARNGACTLHSESLRVARFGLH
ncbi:hypothetical protein DES52_11644 [Deinococcus yavapaiensis KR-236]|uniref:Uncharacterized protein n=1 Tax=Deinococcus yavapaiensis KR-236 TaxID=694435 RepID=A0A318S3F0_9DEIO|nr:hypothetical protein DES52_11644 [Deinococcus yavapaiensis KR-236]